MLAQISRLFLQGLATLLPVSLTVYAVWWLAVSAESLMGRLVKHWIHEEAYHPGMGIAAGIAAIFSLGILMNFWVVRRVVGFGEAALARIPLVKTIYNAVRDMVGLFHDASGQKPGNTVAVLELQDGRRMLGFLTREDCRGLPAELAGEDYVAVYLPMSYQIGGYTAYVPRASVTPIDLDFEAGMRLAVTAGAGMHEAAPAEMGRTVPPEQEASL